MLLDDDLRNSYRHNIHDFKSNRMLKKSDGELKSQNTTKDYIHILNA